MSCDDQHLRFWVTSLVKLHGFAVVSAILIHPEEESFCFGLVLVSFVGGDVLGFCWGFCCCCFPPKMRCLSCFKAAISALAVSIQLLSRGD